MVLFRRASLKGSRFGVAAAFFLSVSQRRCPQVPILAARGQTGPGRGLSRVFADQLGPEPSHGGARARTNGDCPARQMPTSTIGLWQCGHSGVRAGFSSIGWTGWTFS